MVRLNAASSDRPIKSSTDPYINRPIAVVGGDGLQNPYYFTGRRLDFNVRDYINGLPLLTLYHYRARAYDPVHGRFLQRDPAGYVDGMNLYEYVKSNPVNYVDPGGRQKILVMARAFIGGWRGLWFDEPAGTLYDFKGDGRSYGKHAFGLIMPPGPSRLYSDIFIESTKLGSLKGFGVDWSVSSLAGISTRRLKSNNAKVQTRQVIAASRRRVSNSKQFCKSKIEVITSAAYPFVTLSPSIDYTLTLTFEGIARDKVRVSWEFQHNSFPDYELILDASNSGVQNIQVYKYRSSSEGPGFINLNWDAGVQKGSKIVTAEVPCNCKLVK